MSWCQRPDLHEGKRGKRNRKGHLQFWCLSALCITTGLPILLPSEGWWLLVHPRSLQARAHLLVTEPVTANPPALPDFRYASSPVGVNCQQFILGAMTLPTPQASYENKNHNPNALKDTLKPIFTSDFIKFIPRKFHAHLQLLYVPFFAFFFFFQKQENNIKMFNKNITFLQKSTWHKTSEGLSSSTAQRN